MIETNNEVETKKILDDHDLVPFLDGILQKSIQFVQHFDSQTNIIIGISVAVAGASIVSINAGIHTLAFVVMSIFSTLSVIVGLYAVHPPKFMRKRNQKESLFYNKRIASFESSKKYGDELLVLFNNKEDLVQEYSKELYNLYKYYYRPKRKLFKISRDLLLIGIVLGYIFYFLQF